MATVNATPPSSPTAYATPSGEAKSARANQKLALKLGVAMLGIAWFAIWVDSPYGSMPRSQMFAGIVFFGMLGASLCGLVVSLVLCVVRASWAFVVPLFASFAALIRLVNLVQ